MSSLALRPAAATRLGDCGIRRGRHPPPGKAPLLFVGEGADSQLFTSVGPWRVESLELRLIAAVASGEERPQGTVDPGTQPAPRAEACGQSHHFTATSHQAVGHRAKDLHIGAAEAIDGLLLVPHHEEAPGRGSSWRQSRCELSLPVRYSTI